MPFGGTIEPGETLTLSFPRGSVKAIGLAYDNPKPATLRVAAHYSDGHGEVYPTEKVGGPASKDDGWPKKTVVDFKSPAKIDWVSITYTANTDDKAPAKVGWDLGLV